MEDMSVAHLRALIRRTQHLEERIRRIQQSIGLQAAEFSSELASRAPHGADAAEGLLAESPAAD